MAEQTITRKLAAIFYADVVGYSRLTAEDEEGTHRLVSAYLDVLTASIEKHNGTVLNFAGDAVLTEFATVSDALICAVNIQNDLNTIDDSVEVKGSPPFVSMVNAGGSEIRARMNERRERRKLLTPFGDATPPEVVRSRL